MPYNQNTGITGRSVTVKYRVGTNVSFVHAGRVYTEGDEIDEAAFKNETALKSLIAAGKLTTTPAGSGTTPAAGAGSTPAAGSEKEKDKK
jgi:hypothetical protein